MSTTATERRAERKAERAAHQARMAAIHAESLAVVATGHCPDCGAGLHRNTSIAGWWQCDRSGSDPFRRDKTGAACSFQCFTE
jgi:hypothetical protein